MARTGSGSTSRSGSGWIITGRVRLGRRKPSKTPSPTHTHHHRERNSDTENDLFEAATLGDINSLNNILDKDSLILSKFVAGSFNWSPLLVAASHGHGPFVEHLLCKNPDLSAATDARNQTALHLAAGKGHLEVVRIILRILGFSVCLSRDREGWCAVHLAAVNGRTEVLRELIRVNPVVGRKRLEQEKTNVLHLCVEYRQFESLKVLLEMIPDYEFVNAMDYLDNTILHLAAYEKQNQIIKYVLDNTQVNEIALNSSGKTALDIACELGITAVGDEKSEIDSVKELLGASGSRGINVGYFDWLERKDILMLVASVLASTSFQVAVNPPGGVWQDTNDKHRAGESVLAYNYPHVYTYILFTNTFVFLGSVGLMFFLATARNNYFRKRIVVYVIAGYNSTIVCFLAFAYCGSVYAVAPDKGLFSLLSKPSNDDDDKSSFYSEGTDVAVMFVILTFVLMFLYGIIFLIYLLRKVRKRIHRRKDIMAKLQARSPNSCGVTLESV